MPYDHDEAIAWLADLDWTAHDAAAPQHVSKHLSLAKVAESMGQAICEPWQSLPEGLLSHASNDPPGRIVLAEHAFAADGSPIHSIHASVGPAIRRHAERLLTPILAADAITFEEWDAVIDEGADDWQLGLAARRAAAGLAPLFASLANQGKVRCQGRPIGGNDGDMTKIELEDWAVDASVAIRRFASCAMSLAHPCDADAPPTHRIFVEEGGLQNVLVEASRTTCVATAMLEAGGFRPKPTVDYYAVTREAVAERLASLMTDDHLDWLDDRFRAEIRKEFGERAMGRIYEKARAIATAHPDRRRFKRRRPMANA